MSDVIYLPTTVPATRNPNSVIVINTEKGAKGGFSVFRQFVVSGYF